MGTPSKTVLLVLIDSLVSLATLTLLLLLYRSRRGFAHWFREKVKLHLRSPFLKHSKVQCADLEQSIVRPKPFQTTYDEKLTRVLAYLHELPREPDEFLSVRESVCSAGSGAANDWTEVIRQFPIPPSVIPIQDTTVNGRDASNASQVHSTLPNLECQHAATKALWPLRETQSEKQQSPCQKLPTSPERVYLHTDVRANRSPSQFRTSLPGISSPAMTTLPTAATCSFAEYAYI